MDQCSRKSPCQPIAPLFRPSARPTRPMIAPSLPGCLPSARLSAEQEVHIDRTATRLIEAIRANDDPLGGVEDMLREFALSTKEGLALMVLAEALLRVPDARTADQFIEDKLGQGDFVHHETKSSAFLVNASAWALGMSARVIQPRRDAAGHDWTADQAARRAGGARRDAAGDAADGQSFRARRDHRGRARARTAAFGASAALFLRHARRRRAHRRRCQALFQFLCKRDRGDRPRRRQSSPARPARHFRKALGAASALRGREPSAGDERTGSAADRSGAASQGP